VEVIETTRTAFTATPYGFKIDTIHITFRADLITLIVLSFCNNSLQQKQQGLSHSQVPNQALQW
jgi:hypothetical protein